MNHCLYCHHWQPVDDDIVEDGDGCYGRCGRENIRDWVRMMFVRERAQGESDAAMNALGALLEDYACYVVTNARFGCVCWEGEVDAE